MRGRRRLPSSKDQPLDGFDRCYVSDPFGNRLELLEPSSALIIPISDSCASPPPRLLIGLVVLICAEVFSGASIQVGMWAPWTWLMTYWLYFAHFFVLCTLAVWTGRTSLGALYLWGVLFGLYESWITKVIWFGYGGDGNLALGSIGPYGYSEISMVLLFHPVASFLLPLAVRACSVRRCAPGFLMSRGSRDAAPWRARRRSTWCSRSA